MVIRRHLPVVLILALVSGCTPKSSKRTIHEGPRQETLEVAAVTPAEARNMVQTAYADRAAIAARINGADATQALQIALDLEKIVLNPTVLSDPNQAGRSEFDAVLSQFHRALDKAMDLNMNSVVSSGILERYERSVLAYCTPESRTCIRLALFRGDHIASRILMRIAGTIEAPLIASRSKREEILKRIANARQAQASDLDALRAEEAVYFGLVVRYYRLLTLSYEMNNGQATPELDQKYVNFARDYFEYFRKLPADQKQHEFHRRHRDTLTLALGHLRNHRTGGQLSEDYCKFLTDLNPLDAEMFSSMDLDKRSHRSMLAEFVECTAQKGQLNQLIADHVRKMNERATANYQLDKLDQSPRLRVKDEGYAYAMAALSEVPFLYQNLNVELTPRTDLAFFILDRVYYQQMDLNVAQNYWSRVTGLNELEFLKFARNYARIQAAYVLKVTLQNYGRIFSEHYRNRGGLSSDFFHEVVTEVNAVSQFDWDELRDRLTFVREFMIKAFDQKLTRSSAPAQAQAEYLGLKEDLGSLTDHFAMSVTMPMTIPLYYYMAKAQGTIKIHIPWVRSSDQWFDIPASDALATLLRPDYNSTIPFFKFGNIDRSFSAMEKKHIIDYAFRIGVFEFIDFKLLEEDKATGLSAEALFFKQTTKDLLTNFERSFRSEIEKLDTAARNRNFSEAFMNACQDPVNYPVTYELSDLTQNTFLNDKAMVDASSEIYSASTFIFAWRVHRDNVNEMIRVMESHLLGENAEKRLAPTKFDQRRSIIQQVHAEMERFNRLERQLFAKLVELDKQIVNQQRDCLTRLVKAEFFRRNELVAANIEFYKDVHAAMTVLALTKDAAPTTIEDAMRAYSAKAMTVPADVNNRAHRLLTLVKNSGLVPSIPLSEALNEALRIHNISRTAYDTLGFFVTGLATLEEAGKRVKYLNYFTEERFYQGRWDTLIRIRNQLQNLKVPADKLNAALGTNYTGMVPLAPDTTIPLGTFGELEVKSDYIANTTKNVGYNVDQAKFVRDAMIQFGGAETSGTQYVSWFSDSGFSIASLVERRLRWLKDIQELGVIELADSDLTECPRDMWGRSKAVKDIQGRWLPGVDRLETCKAIRVSSADVMEAYLTTLNIYRITDQEREFLEIMDRPQKGGSKLRTYLTYNSEPSTSKWTYFDQFYRKNYTTFTSTTADGASWKSVQIEDIRGRQEFTWFRDFYLRKVENAPALFPMRTAPTQVIRNTIREEILSHLNDIMTFEEAVYNLEERRVDLGDILIERTTTPRGDEPYVFDNWRVMQVRDRATGARQGTPIYLSEENSAKSWFAGYLETFVIKDTDCFVLPQPGDPDFKELTGATCRARYNAWKAERERLRMEIRANFVEANGGAN